MRAFLDQHLWRSRYLPAALVGLLLATAFPNLNFAGAAWVAPALVLACAYGRSGGDAFRIGYVAGLAGWLAQLYWLLLIPVTGFPILGWVALSAYLALFTGAWVWLLAGRIGTGGWVRRTAWVILGAMAWVGLELVRMRLFSGFPWSPLGASQYQMLPLIQLASVLGVYGVSFIIVWLSLAMYSGVVAMFRLPTRRHVWMNEMLLPLVALLAVFVFGMGRLRHAPAETDFLHVTFVQPSIPQTMIWNPADSDRRFAGLLDLTTQALTNETELVLWPEAAVPKMIRYDEATFHTITELARARRVWMIIGSDDAERRADDTDPDAADYFNSSFLISPRGELVTTYRKRNLVIFGEYIPLVRWLPFIKWFSPITGGFTPGTSVVPFELERQAPVTAGNDAEATVSPTTTGADANGKHRVKTATLICFEDLFPHLVRDYVDEDTDFLVNLTNNGWFGESAAQWQHAVSAIFRAVENGVPLLRCSNNGLTCWVDSRGRIRDILRDDTGGIYGPGILTTHIPLLAPGERRERTAYNRHGDWFGWGCALLTALLMVHHWRWGLRDSAR